MDLEKIYKEGKQGDRRAYKLLYEECVHQMLNISYKITGSLHSAEDVFHDAFVKSISKLSDLQDFTKYKSWLKRIVVNKSIDLIRKKIEWKEIEEGDWEEDVEDPHWYRGLSFKQINTCIDLLPDGCKQVLTLYLLEQYKHREVAEILRISVSTSKSQYLRALSLLRKSITEKYKL